jgi:hypothetical protein
MKRAYFVCLFQCLTTTFLLSQSNPAALSNQRARVASPISAAQAHQKAQAKILDSYGKLPLSFEANHGQADGRVKFLSRTGGYTLFLTGDEAVFAMRGKKAKKSSPQGLKPASLSDSGGTTKTMPFSKTVSGTSSSGDDAATEDTTGSVLRMKLRNANPAAKVTGLDELAGTSNYFIGNDPAKWHGGVPTYAKVKYEGIYSGIDLVYYGNQRQLEYDFIVAPGADPRRIVFDVRGAKQIRRDEHGDLVLKMEMGEGEIRWHKPVVYQEKNGTRQEIAARYAITDANRVGFEVAEYDADRPLYIDPLIYSTYLGGSNRDEGYGIAVDRTGNAYVTGLTTSFDFPIKNPLQPTYGGHADVFVSKIDPTGSALVYSTYLGGSGVDLGCGGYDAGSGIAVDSAGNAYVTGLTCSTDFPTMNPLQPANGGGADGEDAFVAKINPTGSALVYSTYLGGSGNEGGTSIAVDSVGHACVTGRTDSTDFPTKNPLQASNPGSVAFVAKINISGSALVYSTYLGGSGGSGGGSIAVDSAHNVYVTGIAGSNFPTMNPFQPTFGGGDYRCNGDAFVTKINATGSALIYSTYLGGSACDQSTSIAVDSAGSAYVTGSTYSTNFPIVNALQPTFGGEVDAFVAKINPTGSALIYSTYLGGKFNDLGLGIAVGSAGEAYVTGGTGSPNFPLAGSLEPGGKGTGGTFVSKLNTSGSAFVYSSLLSDLLSGSGYNIGTGIAVDSAGNAYVTGYTDSTDFPIVNALQPTFGGEVDAFVAKIYIAAATTIKLLSSPDPSTYGQAVTFTAAITSGLGAPPDGETITLMKGTTILGTGALSGGSASFTISTLPVATNPIKAVYGGDSKFGSSTSKALKQVVNKATTTTTLVSSQNPSNVRQSVTFTASVAPQFSGTVKGTLTFYDGTTALKTASLSGGVAKFTTSTLTSGKHSIKATYNGSTNFIGSSASLTQTVN